MISHNTKKFFPYFILSTFLLSLFVVLLLDNPLDQLTKFFAEDHFIFFSIVYIIAIILSTVYSSLTIAPAIPFVSKIFGSENTMIYTVTALMIGSAICFYITRTLGKNVMKFFFPMERLYYMERRLSKKIDFYSLILIRLFSPVDGVSYFVGRFSKMKFIPYMIATFIGILPLSFIFTFGAEAITGSNKALFFSLVLAIALVLFGYLFFKYANSKEMTLVTHNGQFHTDDVFAAAALAILNERRGDIFKLVRTRDADLLTKYKENKRKQRRIVFDVGDVYDREDDLFDHHQEEGAGQRDNGIPYSSFGLVWEKYGHEICRSQDIADMVDDKIGNHIDAMDSGVEIFDKKNDDVKPYILNDVTSNFLPIENKTLSEYDRQFLKAMDFAEMILWNLIRKYERREKLDQELEEEYNTSENKKIFISENRYGRAAFLKYPECLFIVSPSVEGKPKGDWGIAAIPVKEGTFKNRADFPESWGGKRDDDLSEVSGVEDAKFCHKSLFIAGAYSKDGAIKMAELALKSFEEENEDKG